MHVAVLGAGVTGIATAWFLSRQGHDVTVFERYDSVASGTSFANAGQLAYSYVNAMASPEFVAKIPRIVLGRDRGSRFEMRAGLEFGRWILQFLAQSTAGRARKNTLALLPVAMKSEALMRELRDTLSLNFDFRSHGKLVMLRSASDIDNAQRIADLKRKQGCETEIISNQQATVLEPALSQMNGGYTAAVFAPGDHLGDAAKFSIELAEVLQRDYAVTFRMREAIERIKIRSGRIAAIKTIHDEVPVDAAVACLGVWSDELLRPLHIRTHICPIRGYSMTLPAGPHTPTLSVTDTHQRIVFSRLGQRARITGFADFVGFNTDGDRERTASLYELARKTAPLAADYEATRRNRWGGFRPMTPNGIPLAGPTKIDGLYLNTGHGSLGWTLALATAEKVAGYVGSKES